MIKRNRSIRVLSAALAFGFASATVLTACGNTPDNNTAAKYLPDTTEAFATVALSPSIAQKGSLALLSQKLPSGVKDSNKKNITDRMLNELFSSSDSKINYETDIKPWLGKEAALAVLPPAENSNIPIVVSIVQTTDEKKARATLDAQHVDAKLYKYLKGYMFILDKQQYDNNNAASAFNKIQDVVDGTTKSLETRANYKSDLKLLHGEHLALGWVDVQSLAKQAIAEAKKNATKASTGAYDSSLGGLGTYAQLLSGNSNDKNWAKVQNQADQVKSVAFELYAETNALTFDSITEGVSTSGKDGATDRAIMNGLASDITGALDIGGFGNFVRDAVTQAETDKPATKTQIDTDYPGLHELIASLGNEFVIADNADYKKFGVIVEIKDKTAATDALKKLASNDTLTQAYDITPIAIDGGAGSGYKLATKSYSDVYSQDSATASSDIAFIALDNNRLAIARDQATATAMAKGAGNFATSDERKDALGDQSQPTGTAFYLNIKSIVKTAEKESPDAFKDTKPEDKAWIESLKAFGLQAWNQDGHSHLRMHLTFG